MAYRADGYQPLAAPAYTSAQPPQPVPSYAAAPTHLDITVPPGYFGGLRLQVQTSTGPQTAIIPMRLGPGDVFAMHVAPPQPSIREQPPPPPPPPPPPAAPPAELPLAQSAALGISTEAAGSAIRTLNPATLTLGGLQLQPQQPQPPPKRSPRMPTPRAAAAGAAKSSPNAPGGGGDVSGGSSPRKPMIAGSIGTGKINLRWRLPLHRSAQVAAAADSSASAAAASTSAMAMANQPHAALGGLRTQLYAAHEQLARRGAELEAAAGREAEERARARDLQRHNDALQLRIEALVRDLVVAHRESVELRGVVGTRDGGVALRAEHTALGANMVELEAKLAGYARRSKWPSR